MTDANIRQVTDAAECGKPPDQIDVLADHHRLVETANPTEGGGVHQESGARHVGHRLADADVGRRATKIQCADALLEPRPEPGPR